MLKANEGRAGRARSVDSQVVRHPSRRDTLSGGSLRTATPGADRTGEPVPSRGIHHATGHTGSSKRNRPAEVHCKWRVYTFAASCAFVAGGLGATLTEAFHR